MIPDEMEKKNILKILGDKDILFLEDDNSLEEEANVFRSLLIDNKIRHNVLFDLSALPEEYILNRVRWSDVIVFQSTGTTDVYGKLREYITKMPDKKIIIEVYVYMPNITSVPKGVPHDVYVVDGYKAREDNTWNVKKITHKKGFYSC